MADWIAVNVWIGVAVYAGFGLVFSLPFILFWAGKVDPAAKRGSWGFRALVLPATIAVWPILMLRVYRGRSGSGSLPDPEFPVRPGMLRLLHGIAFAGICAVIPFLIAASMWSQNEPAISRVNLNPAPISGPVVSAEINAVSLPIRLTMQTGLNDRRVDIEVADPLDSPVVGVYWSPVATAGGIGSDAVFLGSVWGPARHTFSLPEAQGTGVLTFIALAPPQRVLETIAFQ